MNELNLVIGANGHLGNNLVRQLQKKGKRVRASVRNINYKEPFHDLECDIVYADLLDKDALLKAIEGVDTIFVAAAVYKSWAKDVQEEIINVNVEGTRNIMRVAAKQGVKKIIYVSSTLALDCTNAPVEETSGWNLNSSDPYTQSKIEAEKLAWNLAAKYNMALISVIPSAMVGPNCYGHLTPSMEVLSKILKNKIPFDPCFNFNYIDIRDAANAMITAAEKGRKGERYILAQEHSISSTELFKLAHSLYPTIKIPKKASYAQLYFAASVMELISKITRKKPLMLRSQVKQFSKTDCSYNRLKARKELGFNPRTPTEALKDAFEYIMAQIKN